MNGCPIKKPGCPVPHAHTVTYCAECLIGGRHEQRSDDPNGAMRDGSVPLLQAENAARSLHESDVLRTVRQDDVLRSDDSVSSSE